MNLFDNILFPGGFTVLMAVYGRDDVGLFCRAVESVYKNTIQPSAFVLVVDGPVPVVLDKEITRLSAQYPIDVLRLANNSGLASALNEGLQLVHTEWVVRADSDDYNLPYRFERIAKYINEFVRLDIIGSSILEVEKDGSPLAIRATPKSHKALLSYAKKRNPFNHMAVAYRKELAMKCGGYPRIFLKEDYGLWALMIRAGAVMHNIDDALVHATAGRGMYQRRGGVKYVLSEFRLQRHLVDCGLKSIFSAVVDGIIRSIVFVIPASLRGFIYVRLLRKKIA